ncbi:hypothetical protein DTO207G8_2639 [Paecilomyces variotii]|nr:hypothetical protein DTO169C6_6756 [Paecilomyces variotii]KAJ9256069.1 hypothetical protein DTO207G8_2639 [Paecilomyces variotii]KAJ9355460.1 hypothetical protein DTO027B9_4217 [Paecilomyces variotii]KAJ9387684.1 hypothetical protein DTO063F5_2910 [Paecilomyces variotii]
MPQCFGEAIESFGRLVEDVSLDDGLSFEPLSWAMYGTLAASIYPIFSDSFLFLPFSDRPVQSLPCHERYKYHFRIFHANQRLPESKWIIIIHYGGASGHRRRRHRRPNADHQISTATTMEALGIRVWPPGYPAQSYPAAGHPGAPPPARTYAPTYTTNYGRPLSWNTYGLYLPQYYSLPPEMNSVNDLLPNPVDRSFHEQKPADHSLDYSSLETDLGTFPDNLLPADENHSLVNVRGRPPEPEHELLKSDDDTRRFSGSSFSISSVGGGSIDVPDISSYPDPLPYPADYTPRSSMTLSSNVLSPVPTPRYPPTESSRTGSRGKASPSPRPNMRAAPYTLDGGRKRWSTGSYGPSPVLRSSPLLYPSSESYHRATNVPKYSVPSVTSNTILPPSNLAPPPVLGSSPARFHRRAFLLPSSSDNRVPNPLRLLSQGPFRTLQSSADPHGNCLDHYASLFEPPDLLGPLREEQVPPPPEDLHPDDPDLAPHEQELRFENDLYTPRWVRGHGNKREGWCGICKPGRWLVLKNSAFWYDKSFTHGVSAATGQAFEPPRETRRMEGNADVWEGLCGSCGEWIALVSSKKKGTTWFRHAYKCHSHPKIKDAPKRRRENGRPSTATASPRPGTPAPPRTDAATTHPAPATSAVVESALSNVKTVSPLHTISSMI